MWSSEESFSTTIKENIEVPTTPSHGKWYGPCTPQTDRRSGSARESPRLSLTMFAKTPRISFGKVKIGCSKVKRVTIENPLSIAQSLHLDKWPESKGFTILKPVEHGGLFESCDVLERSVEFIIAGMSEVDLPIMWKPNAEGSYRELVSLNLGDFNRLNVIVFGNAVDTSVKPVKPKMKTLLPDDVKKGAMLSSQKRKMSKTDKQSTSSMKSKRILRESNAGLPEPKPSVASDISAATTKPIIKSELNKVKEKATASRKFKTKVTAKGVAPSRLKLTKHLTTERSLPRHPLPYAAKNMYYDEKWIEKQERGFVQWLNYVLTPPDELASSVQSESSCIFSNHETTGRKQHLAPTKEVLSLRAYTARRKMARLRRSACLLYQSQPVAFVAKTIEGEVEKNRLSIRVDKHFHQDLGIKETMLKMLLSYNSLWLRIGLETIYGEILPLQSNHDAAGLKRFLKKRFLANSDIAKEYRHATVAEAYRPGYYEALKKFTLKKFLLLILFLDKAKLTRLIDHDPCLFNKEAEFKSSRLLLLSFSRDYLKGEGDVTKHLGLLNYIVTHEQVPLDEMDYAVTNLAVDLRDGLRITRVIELLTQNWSLTANLRVPAISRLQKIHNVDVALNALKEKEILSEEELNSVNPRHIVDGHREKTLSLLWMIILHFQVNQVVNEQQIKDEIAFLRKYYVQRNPHFKAAIVEHTDDVYSKSEKLSLLLEWCRSVCRLFGVKVDNFTVSMSDGRVMCYLLHYYHPRLLKEEEICRETTQTCNPYTNEDDSIDDDSLNSKDKSFSHQKGEPSPRLSQLKYNEKRNHELLREKVKELGGVPSMLRLTDLSCTIPDEKVIITYLSYLCARLLDLRFEGRAARIIQLAWRRHLEEKQAREIKRKNEAVSVIQKYTRRFLERQRQKVILHSTIIIQAYARGYKVRRDLRHSHQAAAVIQSYYRGYRVSKETRHAFTNLKQATLRIQSLYRGKTARRHVRRIKATRMIQSRWRGYLARREFLAQKRAVVVLQAGARKFFARRRYQRLQTASVIIQRRYRAKMLAKQARGEFISLKTVVVNLQAICRGNIARKEVGRLKAAIVIQKSVKMWRCRQKFLKSKNLITKLQAAVRRNIAQKRYKELVCAAVVIQQRWKAYRQGVVERKAYHRLKSNAVVIQSHYRKYVARKQYLAERNAIILAQACIRGFQVRKEMRRRENACRTIQRYLREYLLMKKAVEEYRNMKRTAIYLQALWRGKTARSQFKQQKATIVSAQARIRKCLARKQYLRTKSAAIILQVRYRALKEMRQQRHVYLTMRGAVITLQASLRAAKCVKQYQRQKQGAVVLQTRWRAVLCSRKAMKEYHCIRGSVITIQAFARGLKARKMVKRQRAAIKIQARWRGAVQKKSYLKTRDAAILIQDCFRMVIARRKYEMLKNTTVYLQRLVRANQLCRRQTKIYQITRNAVITLQAAVRGYSVRKELNAHIKAATIIQTTFRRYFIRQKYMKIYWSALVIQRRRRATILCREAKAEYQSLKCSVVFLQSHVRGFLARKYFQESYRRVVLLQSAVRRIQARNNYLKMREAALTIQERYQAYVKGCAVRKLYHLQRGASITVQANVRRWIYWRRYQQLRTAVKIIQVYYGATVCAKGQRKEYLEQRGAAITIQSFTRGWLARRAVRKLRAAICVQNWWRMCVARESYTYQRRCVIQIQSLVRMRACRRRYLALQDAVVRVQTRFRANLLCRKEKDLFMEMKGSCFMIQHCYRFYRQRRLVRKMLESVSTMRNAAVVIQRRFRANQLAKLTQSHYRRLRASTIHIQAVYRGYKTRAFVARLRAAIVIQSYYRGYRQRNDYESLKKAVIKMQALTRGKQTCHEFKKLRSATVMLQRRRRACVLGNLQRKTFLTQKNSAVVIQSFYRGYRERTRYERLRQAVIKVQSLLRGKIAREEYSELRKATVVLQTRERARKIGQVQRTSFLTLKKYTVCLQSRFRGKRDRTRYLETKNAVIKLQALARCKRAQRAFERTRNAAIVIQRKERARVAGKRQREMFLRQRQSSVLIQSIVRCYQQRKRYLELRHAVITMQAYVRGKAARNHFHTSRVAAIVLQRRERARIVGKRAREEYLEKRRSAILIQNYVRGLQQRACYLELRHAVVNMQAHVRRKVARNHFHMLRVAAIVLQRRERAHIVGKRTREEYLEKRRSAILIQSYARRLQQRKRYLNLRHAVITMQAHVRGKAARNHFHTSRVAAIVLQRKERARILGRRTREEYLKKRRSAILIQSYARGLQQRKSYLKLRQAVITMQAHVRGKVARNHFHTLRVAAIVLQRRERARIVGKRTREEYLEKRKSAILIQSYARRLQQRKSYLKLRHTVITMQAHVRGKAARNHFHTTRVAVIVLQRRERARVVGKRTREEYLEKQKSAILIQSHVKGLIQQVRYLELRHAAIVVQARVRRQQARNAYQKTRAAAIVIQRKQRARVVGKIQRENFQQERRSAVLIQSATRCYQQRTRYLQLKHAATLIQAYVRGKRTQSAYQQLRHAAVVIQRRERARTLGKVERKLFLTKKRSAVLIQSWLRGCRERKMYNLLRRTCVRIQAFVRGYQERRKYTGMKMAALCIQEHYRAYLLGREELYRYQEFKNSTITIQSYYRGHCARQLVKRIQASTVIQAAYRSYIARHQYLQLRKATIHLQSLQRMRQEQTKYRELKTITIKLQRRVKANQLGRKTKSEYLETRNKIIHFQALWRGLKARENVRRIKSARVIARWYRACVEGRRVRAKFVLLREAVINMQACYRGNVARRHFKREQAARTIQAYVRGHQARQLVKKLQAEKAARLLRFSAAAYMNLMVIRLQRSYRKARAIALFKAKIDRLVFLQRWWRARLQRLSYLRTRYLVCLVQRKWRKRFAVKKESAARIQAVVRSFFARQTAEKRKEAILVIQCAWRGYSVRKRFNTSKFRRTRQRILVANSNVTEPMKLCNRTRSALDYLLKCKNLTTVREAFLHLEVASRLSRKCTEQLVMDNALSVIFKVVRDSNRSLAHMGLIKLALDIFVNVSKCFTTKDAVVTKEPDSLDTLVELACIFREKHDIFLRVIKLLTILCEIDEIRKSLLNMEKSVNKIKSIFTLTKRKHDFEMKRNTAKAKRLSVSTQKTKKTDCSLNPLAAVTNLIETLHLDI